MKRPCILVIFLLAAAFSCNNQQQSPNVIFILTDDLGYGDIGVLYQNQRKEEGKPYHQTPHLDKMAEEGMVLTRHYVPAPVCAPSRASLLRGVHQGNAEIRNNQFDKALPDNHTIASVLKEAGYATAIIGKYGLQGKEGNSPETWQAYPTKRGFDHFVGYVRHGDGHNHYPAHQAAERPPKELYAGTEEISSKLEGCYTTDLFTAEAKKWIAGHQENNAGQPFFLYLAYDTPHAGLQVASAPYPEGGGLTGGVQWTGEPGRYINTATDSIDTYIHPDYAGTEWPMVHKKHASMVRRIDNGVGDILQLLLDLGIDDKTLIVFTSDNGPHNESYGYGDYAPTLFDSYGPFDGIKRDTWEGGIRTPLIVRWPGHIPAGTENSTPTQFHDWLPTFAQLAGLPAPAITDGVSLLPLLKGEKDSLPSKIYIEYSVYGTTPSYDAFHESHKNQTRGEMQVIYLDGYKGIRYNILSAGDDFRIYDTQKDPGETIDLAGTGGYFEEIQKKMKDRVLQMRRPDIHAPRPYDSVPVPAVEISGPLVEGLQYRLFETTTPWTPDVTTLGQEPEKSGISDRFDPGIAGGAEAFVLAYEGLLHVPETGEYRFHLRTDGGAVLRLHEACFLDADKPGNPNTEAEAGVFLEKGYHPLKLVFRNGGQADPVIKLDWSGPGFSEVPVAPGNVFHRGAE